MKEKYSIVGAVLVLLGIVGGFFLYRHSLILNKSQDTNNVSEKSHVKEVIVIPVNDKTNKDILQTSTTSPLKEFLKFIDGRPGEGERESKTFIVDNDPYKTITQDFKYGTTIIYTTKDKSKIYFALYAEKEGQECVPLNYLDTNENRYVKTKLEYCPDSRNDNFPFVIQYGKLDFQNLYALNLEKGNEIIIYSIKSDKESLIAKCAEGIYDFVYVPDIRDLPENKLSIGVYKNGTDKNTQCVKSESYPKIRDDIVDLKFF